MSAARSARPVSRSSAALPSTNAISAKTSPKGAYSLVSSTAPFSSRTVQLAPSGRRSTPTSDAPAGRRRSERDRGRAPGRLRQRTPGPAERDVGAPLARRRDPEHRADCTPFGDDDAEVVAARRHELLDESAVAREPARVPDPRERSLERLVVVAALHLAPPAPEAGLHDDGELRHRHRAAVAHVPCSGMRDPLVSEEPGREQLVVRAEQRGRIVQHDDSARRERPERPQAVVHPVERREHVEPSQRDVVGNQDVERLLGRHELPAGQAGDVDRGQRLVRGRGPPRDDRESHADEVPRRSARYKAFHRLVTAFSEDGRSDRSAP